MTNSSVPLQERIAEKIASIQKTEQDTPSIVIIHDLRTTSVVYMSPRGLRILGVTMKELIQMGPDYHPRFFNMEFLESYAPKIYALLERNQDDEVISYFQQVRANPNEEWTWYTSCTKILMRDDEGKPLLIITNAVPVDAQHYFISAKGQKLLDESSFQRKNRHLFDSLTKREKEILKMIALGLSSVKMAKQMHISEKTANTHRRNIKRKLHAETNYDIVRFAHAFDLI